ncbi:MULTISPECIES: RNA polymerase sigma factor [Pectobacterium]|uniref:RNA polymerase sigma factor n=1 Tax=Pectobacterium TaxID=122277 RepID=UPI001968E479|nr:MULTISPECIES: sigma-70 family RNA polymerase sigma factor [Pectobacterium]GKW10076.1 DNA-directed RNA polymerase sigma-70 factor [Pectobacterium carotovorum subsp. carotovorum]MBN3136776.1 sigma-70 family RNA polymerase sigma factor [Pectobacterium punjabense]MBT9183105.1 sigma-70 family RNA polymerase sigma factor [Pectobacterium punjabense]MCE5378543.1 sigma-70 family RNA polymerase sigma factor [Pectobacterium punjabense]MCE9731077.1 RNA polymerase subunit sigma-70 [Pectobacterium sp. IF
MSESELRMLFNHYAERLERYLNHKLRDPQAAADLVQESFLRLAQRLEQQDDVDDKKAYLYKTANNLLLDHVRHQQRWQMATGVDDVDTTLDSLPDAAPQLDRTAIAQQELERLANVLLTLPERTQQIFHLHRFEHMTQAQIAQQLDISLSTVEKHLAMTLHAMLTIRSS